METLNTARIFEVGIIARRGDTLNIELSFQDDEGNPIDMTGSTFRCNALPVSFTAPNILKIQESAEDMANRSLGDYNYDIEETKPSGTVKTIVGGILTIKKDYTI